MNFYGGKGLLQKSKGFWVSADIFQFLQVKRSRSTALTLHVQVCNGSARFMLKVRGKELKICFCKSVKHKKQLIIYRITSKTI